MQPLYLTEEESEAQREGGMSPRAQSTKDTATGTRLTQGSLWTELAADLFTMFAEMFSAGVWIPNDWQRGLFRGGCNNSSSWGGPCYLPCSEHLAFLMALGI